MIKKLIVTLFIICLTNLTVLADCVTGYACSLKELQQQESVQKNENNVQQTANQSAQQEKKSKNEKKGLFVDGKENNSPKYTEMFTLKGIIP